MRQRLVTLAASAAVVALFIESTGGHAAAQTAIGGPPPQARIAPDVVPSLAPADAPTSLPYPAYGAPVSGVREGVAVPGVPHVISLKDAIAVAVARSPQLTGARADVGVAQAEVRLARAGLLPSLSADVTAEHLWFGNNGADVNSVNSANGNGGNLVTQSAASITNQQSNTAGLSLSQLIFDGGRIAAGVRAARETETAAADTYRREMQTVAYDVANAYYTALADERTTAVDVEIVREDEVQLSLVQAQVRAGVAAQVDAVTAALPVAQARIAVVQAQGNEVAARAAFANTLGIDANADVQPADDVPILDTAHLHTIPVVAYRTAIGVAQSLRPDLAASQASLDSAKANLRVAKLGLFPTLSGSAGQTFNSTSIGGGAYSHTTSVGATLSIPIYNQGQTPAEVAEAQANVDLASANYQTVLLGVQLSVKQGLAQLVSAKAAVAESQIALNEAEEVLRATQAQYRAQVTTLPQLLNSQVGLSQALVAQVNAVYSLRQAEQTYLYASGQNAVQ